jgi:hypothetical protein
MISSATPYTTRSRGRVAWIVVMTDIYPIPVVANPPPGAATDPRDWATGTTSLRRERFSSSIARTVRSTA